MTTLVIPGNLELLSTEHAGRTLRLTTDARKGTVVLTDTPFCHVIHQKFRSTTCDLCYTFSETDGEPLLQACECGIHYCSEACQLKALPRHQGVCGFTNREIIGGGVGRKKTSANRNNKKLMTSVNLLLSAVSNPLPLATLYNQIDESSISVSTPGKKRRLEDSDKCEVALKQMMPCPLPAGSYAHALNTVHFNAIGLYDAHGDESGFLVSPLMAMVNHSCVPNCCQLVVDGTVTLTALRHIEAGEELSYSYVSMEGGDRARMESILDTWGFECNCRRCRGEPQAGFDKEHVCVCGSICLQVDRTTSECVCHPAKVLPLLSKSR